MKLEFPSREFDDAVAAVCHDQASDEQMRALNMLLGVSSAARDQYLLRLELHSRLASDSDLFASSTEDAVDVAKDGKRFRSRHLPPPTRRSQRPRRVLWSFAIAVSVALFATVVWRVSRRSSSFQANATSKAVAMLNETASARWDPSGQVPQLGAPLEPGWLKLDAGLAQIVFYSGARVVVEGPAELQLISSVQARCVRGRITAEVPPQARGFRIDTPQGKVTDLGTAFGLEVTDRRTEVHVFKGEVTLQSGRAGIDDNLHEGAGAIIEAANAPRRITADEDAFASLFELQTRSSALEAQRFHQWHRASEDLNRDPALAVRLLFEDAAPSSWRVRNMSAQSSLTGDAVIVGCQRGQGRWTGKYALEFQTVSDRVRLNVPGERDALTLAAWVRVQGLDRELNSLFMCDGFSAGSVHWLIRNDGVMGLTVVGAVPGEYQIATSPPVLTLDRLGTWMHLAVVLDGRSGRVTHYVNGHRVGENSLRIKPPYRIGAAELGNWNAKGFPERDPFMIRNFSGAMDEFCLFVRALDAREVNALYAAGRPDAEILASHE